MRALLIAAASLLLSLPALADAADQRALTLEAIFQTPAPGDNAPANIRWTADGRAFLYLGRNARTGAAEIVRNEISSGKERVVIPSRELAVSKKPIAVSRFERAGEKYFLIAGAQTRTWDGVMEAPFYVYDAASRRMRALGREGAPLRNVALSPDGARVGYVYENNLYIADLDSLAETAVTSDGDENIFNGIFDYGSTEFDSMQAWNWSPDGTKIAFWRLDATNVKTFYIVDELGKYNTVKPLKYPDTGEAHAVIKIGVYDVADRTTLWMDTGDNPDDYIPRVGWTADSHSLVIQRLARDHKTLDLLLGDIRTGRSERFHTESDPAWIDITDDLIPLSDPSKFIWTSEKSGFRHAYLLDTEGGARAITQGDWEITSLIDVDEAVGWLYFYAKKDALIDRNVYRVRLDGTGLERLTREAGWHEWRFSPDHKYVVATNSDANTPPSLVLENAAGETIRVLSDGATAPAAQFARPRAEFFSFKTSDGVSLNAMMIKPRDFDPSKKYPVIAYAYGNAGSQIVVNRWGIDKRSSSRHLWHYYMADQGYIIFLVDNRTTSGRGKKAKNLTYGHYGKYAVSDELEAAEYLGTLPYIDRERLGFWGWSGGAYLACALMTKGAPNFKVGVSVAPVIDLERYQSVGVERWMGQLKDNPEGYFDVNVMNDADKLEGKLLLIHGTGDENVKFAYTLQFADSLIKAGKQFDMMVYPNQHHALTDVQLHVYTKITDYFRDNL
ncbi:MAG: S9 family peptidase [Parvularculaceae bacterium]|nr:S9 family peptidase [Parvularculaceae bacterium]